MAVKFKSYLKMRKENIYNIAMECKNISDNEIRITEVVTKDGVIRFASGNVKFFEKALRELCEAVKEVYPLIYNDLLIHIEEYDSNCVFHQRAIDEILDSLITVEKSNNQTSRKIFVSHASVDATIVNAFVKEILLLGCGFKANDIFCTLDRTSIRTGDDFRNEIIANMKSCDFIICMISENYRASEVCQNEMGAAWALEGKRILPFKFPNLSFNEIGFLNVVKQCADITDKSKLDELYKELCEFYEIEQDWMNYNTRTADFIKIVNDEL